MVRQLVNAISIISLAVGAGLCLLGLAITIPAFGIESMHHSLQRGIPSAVLLLVTGAYAILYRRRHWSAVALFAYLCSFVILALVLRFWINGYIKGFPPLPADEAAKAALRGIAWISGAVLLAVATYLAAWRHGRSQNRSTSY